MMDPFEIKNIQKHAANDKKPKPTRELFEEETGNRKARRREKARERKERKRRAA